MNNTIARIAAILAGLSMIASAAASDVSDFARQWPLSASEEGAYSVLLDASVVRQVTQADLSDIAAFNANGEPLPFGPMPSNYSPPPSAWRDAAWFKLPGVEQANGSDLYLHISRSAAGDLNLDTTLRHTGQAAVQDILIDVRAKDQDVEAIAFELALDAPDFSAQVSIEASDDLQHWRNVVDSATVAQLRQAGQALVRRHIEFSPQSAAYLRIHVLGADQRIPVRSVRLLLRPTGPMHGHIRRTAITADYVGREGRAYVYRSPAPVALEQLNIVLGDDNAIANFSVSARNRSDKHWSYVGQLNAFRLRAAGLSLDNEAMAMPTTRQQEWRIESNTELAKIPVLELSYRPENWLLLTHGKPPFVIAAGSPWARRGEFPLEALVAQVRTKYGDGWQPVPANLGTMRDAGGEAALHAYDPKSTRTWLLWGVLLLAAVAVIVMVLRLLKSPPSA